MARWRLPVLLKVQACFIGSQDFQLHLSILLLSSMVTGLPSGFQFVLGTSLLDASAVLGPHHIQQFLAAVI